MGGSEEPENDPEEKPEEDLTVVPGDFTGVEDPIILESAHRHGVAEEDMLHALRFAIDHVRQADNMVMFIGPDTAGSVLVEVGVVIWWGEEFAIVHAMKPAREKYLRLKPKSPHGGR